MRPDPGMPLPSGREEPATKPGRRSRASPRRRRSGWVRRTPPTRSSALARGGAAAARTGGRPRRPRLRLGSRSVGRRELPRPLRGAGAGCRAGARGIAPRRPAGPHLLRPRGRPGMGPRPADEALRTLDAARREIAHPYRCSPSLAARDARHASSEAWSTACEAGERLARAHGALGGEAVARRDRDPRRRQRGGGRAPAPFCERARRSGRVAHPLATRRSSGASCARSAATTRPSRSRSSGASSATSSDVWTQALWRQVQALVDAYRGDHAQAERLAREAVAIIEPTDMLNQQGDALCDLAEVLAAAGRTDEAAERARAGARALRAQEEPGHGRAGAPAARGASRPA